MSDSTHHLGLELGEVVVDRDHVDALTGQGVEVRRERGDEGLALTGLHLGDVAEVERGGTHDLHVERTHPGDPLGGLADRGERFRHQVVEVLTVGEPPLELVGHAAELVVAHGDKVVLDRVHGLGHGLELAEDLPLADAEELVKNGRHER